MSDNDLGDWDAAYVLGALSTEDRLAYEEYLAANPDRAVAVTEFAALPGILNALTPQEALALDAPAGESPGQTQPLDLMPSLARAAAKRQKRSRRTVIALMGATAAAFLAIGIVATLVFGMARTPSTIGASPPLQAMAPTDRGGIVASLAVSEKTWGTRLDWKCQYTKGWSKNVASYDLVVTTDDGKQTPVASWRPGSGDEANGLAAATSIPTSRIRAVDIRVSGTSTPLAVTTVH